MIEGNTNPDWLGNQTIYEMISRRFQCFVVVVCQRIGQIATLRGLVIKIFLQKVLQYVCMRGQTTFYMFRFHKILRNMCQRIAQTATLQAGDQNISPKSATDSLLYVKVPQNTQKYVSTNCRAIHCRGWWSKYFSLQRHDLHLLLLCSRL